MECNRDEAIRAKTIAEGKLEKKDFAGAKRFALKAQSLYPGLDGLSQMVTTLDVYISAENKISGEVDWYAVLGVNPLADDDTIKKQYKKLALMLHPDKNKTVGADGAFKLLSEAWSLLSDKAKRLAYNQRRSARGFQQKVNMHTGGPSAHSRANGYHNFTSNFTGRTTSIPKTQNHNVKVPPASIPRPPQRPDTFWTICHRCKMHYEYLKIYLNHTLLCPNCHEAFLASETAPPFNHSRSSSSASRQRHQNSSNHAPTRNPSDQAKNASASQKSGPTQGGPNLSSYSNFQKGDGDSSIAAKAANVVQQAQEKMKRAYSESHAPGLWEGDSSFKRRKLDDDGSGHGVKGTYNMAAGNGGFGSASASGTRIYDVPGAYSRPKELTPLETRKMLVEKARKVIQKKLNEWKSDPSGRGMDNVKIKGGKKDRNGSNGSTGDIHGSNQNGESKLSANKAVDQAEKDHSVCNAKGEDPERASMVVPDPDFHDFDQDRAEGSFGENEVWAAYDDDDGMPRFYALINKVISRKPFKLRLSWLNSKTTSEFGSIDWVGSGFYKTCGEFRVGRYETCKSINSFSQKVEFSKGPRGTILIYPKKGDVWALYKNWSPEWNEQTPDEVIHKYDMVMALEDYNEENGVSVAPLIKVFGFKTIFRPDLDAEKLRRIPKEEMFRFSHRVPKWSLTGEEAQNAPKGCLELDPAATPLELLQVTVEANEAPTMPNGGDPKEELQSVPETRVGGIAEAQDTVKGENKELPT